jgi:hypothetical protein
MALAKRLLALVRIPVETASTFQQSLKFVFRHSEYSQDRTEGKVTAKCSP